MLQALSADKCIERIKSYLKNEILRKPIFINAENQETYISLKADLANLAETVCISNFCANYDENPDLDALYEKIVPLEKNVLLIGLTMFLKLKGEWTLKKHLRRLSSSTVNGKLMVLCYQTESYLKELYNKDHRLEQQIYLVKGETSQKPLITFYNSSLNLGKDIIYDNGIKALLQVLEENKQNSYSASTSKGKVNYPDSLISLSEIKDSYDAIILLDQKLKSAIPKSYGTENQWCHLLTLLTKYKTIEKVFLQELSTTSNFDLIFNKWGTFSSDSKWLYFIALKVFGTGQSNCLSFAIDGASSVDEFITNVFRGILNKKITDVDFEDFYQERKQLVNGLDDYYVVDYCNYAKKLGHQRIYYLTDNTLYERKQIVECLSNDTFGENEIAKILSNVYPDLAKYLSPYRFNKPLLDNYFQSYKMQKITNQIQEDFLMLVEEHAAKREYNSELPYRSEKIESIDKNRACLFFADALGVEFLGFIMHKCRQYDLKTTITICHSNLPSITSENNEFISDFDPKDIYPFKELDQIKHHGAYDFDFQKTKLPIHITKELEVIDNALRHAKNLLFSGEYGKVIFISDHGASRLAVINNQELVDIDVDIKGLHSGRCCVYNNQIPEIQYATEERGFYVLANYKRFKGSRKASVETHGGATLEEVVVPIIELTLSKENIEVEFIDSVILVSYRKKAEITLFSKSKLSSVYINVNGNFYNGISNDGHTYKILMPDISKIGNYHADIYEGDNLIAESLEFIVEKEGSKEKDLFDF